MEAGQERLTRDHVGGVLMIAVGVAVAVTADGYEIGSLRSMGSGFFPLVLGVLLVLVGVAIVATTPLRPRAPGPTVTAAAQAVAPAAPAAAATAPPPAPGRRGIDVRAWSCILAAILAFVLLGRHGGLVPASFASVFIAALGDRGNGVRDAAWLAAAMTAFGVVVFHYGLRVLLPLFAW
jgi:drug/metabolite transporter (DMT)-like permease